MDHWFVVTRFPKNVIITQFNVFTYSILKNWTFWTPIVKSENLTFRAGVTLLGRVYPSLCVCSALAVRFKWPKIMGPARNRTHHLTANNSALNALAISTTELSRI